MTHRRTSTKKQVQKLADRKKTEKQLQLQKIMASLAEPAPVSISPPKLQSMLQAHSQALCLLHRAGASVSGLCDLSRQLKAMRTHPAGTHFTNLDLFQLKRRLIRARNRLLGWRTLPGVLPQIAAHYSQQSVDTCVQLDKITIPLLSQNDELQVLANNPSNLPHLKQLEAAEAAFLDTQEAHDAWESAFQTLMATLASINLKAYNPPLTSITKKASKKTAAAAA